MEYNLSKERLLNNIKKIIVRLVLDTILLDKIIDGSSVFNHLLTKSEEENYRQINKLLFGIQNKVVTNDGLTIVDFVYFLVKNYPDKIINIYQEYEILHNKSNYIYDINYVCKYISKYRNEYMYSSEEKLYQGLTDIQFNYVYKNSIKNKQIIQIDKSQPNFIKLICNNEDYMIYRYMTNL